MTVRRRNRDIGIFGVSALDLFASALGAFIIMSVVLFPYFTNTSRRVVEGPAPPSEPTVARQFPHLDLIIALDVSDSMGGSIAQLKAEIGELIEVLAGLTPSVAMGLVAFGDRRWERPVIRFEPREVGGSRASRRALVDFVGQLEADMGRGGGENLDGPEAFLAALRAAKSMDLRARAQRKIIVVVTDNPAYPGETTQAIAEARDFVSRGGGRAVSTVFVPTENAALETPAFLAQVAAAGGGRGVRDAGGSITATLLLSLM